MSDQELTLEEIQNFGHFSFRNVGTILFLWNAGYAGRLRLVEALVQSNK